MKYYQLSYVNVSYVFLSQVFTNMQNEKIAPKLISIMKNIKWEKILINQNLKLKYYGGGLYFLFRFYVCM